MFCIITVGAAVLDDTIERVNITLPWRVLRRLDAPAQAEAIVAFNHRDYGNAPARFGLLLLLPAEACRRIEA